MKRIKIAAGYGTCEELVERLLLQFKTEWMDLSNVEFVCDDSYDIIVFFNYVIGDYDINKKAYLFHHEPSWAGTHQKNFKDSPNLTIFGFDKDLYEGHCEELFAHTYYGGRGPWMDKLDFWNYDNLINKKFEKTKGISSCITRLKDNNSETCLYPVRYEIAEMVSTELPFIDMYGYGDERFKEGEKSAALVDYKFNLVIENEYQNNWITEKFYDCVLTDTIPIYFGCKNIKSVYPEDGYILIEDINNLEQIKNLLENINNNLESIYKSKIENLRKIKQRYFREYNLLNKIINL